MTPVARCRATITVVLQPRPHAVLFPVRATASGLCGGEGLIGGWDQVASFCEWTS